MLKAKLDSVRRNKKGFSLVELIIVIAIMVALIVVMAPAYVKYVQKSHDAVVEAAAESVLQFVKAEMADGTLTGVGKIKIYGTERDGSDKKYIKVEWIEGDLQYQPEYTTVEGNGEAEFLNACGVDDTKQIRSDVIYIIEVKDTQTVSGHPNKVAEMETLPDGDNG